ncbi:MAG: choice-of-anchor J domain-containing protein, partial [Chitinophagaceae bacterium]
MSKLLHGRIVAVLLVMLVMLGSCKDDAFLMEPPAVANQSFTEEFDTVSRSLARGWTIINASTPKIPQISTLIWQQGGDVIPWFNAFSENGSNVGFIGASAEISASVPPSLGIPVISNWLVSPVVVMQNGDKISFYTRTRFADATTDFGNRLQLRATFSESINVGAGEDAGAFTENLLDINPAYLNQEKVNPSPLGFPADWTRFEVTLTGLNKSVSGRFAFRYLITDG